MTELHRNAKIDVGTDAVVVSKDIGQSPSKRVNILIINTSTAGQVITLAIDGVATSDEGIVLNPGGSWSDNSDAGYKPTQKQITAISSSANGQLSIQERLEQ